MVHDRETVYDYILYVVILRKEIGKRLEAEADRNRRGPEKNQVQRKARSGGLNGRAAKHNWPRIMRQEDPSWANRGCSRGILPTESTHPHLSPVELIAVVSLYRAGRSDS